MAEASFHVWAVGDGTTVNPRNGNLWAVERELYEGPARGEHRRRNRVWEAEGGTVSLRAARNEVVAFQIVIEAPEGGLGGVNVEVKGELGAVVQLYREKYVPIEGSWYADPLLPFELEGAAPFAIPDPEWGIEGQSNQAVWVDVYVPPDAKPGIREGRIVVSAEGEREVEFGVTLEALPFALPAEVHVDCELNCYGGLERQVPGGDLLSPEYLAFERSYYRLAHDHRANLNILPYLQNGKNHDGFAPELAGEGKGMRVTDWSGYDARFGPYFDGSAFEGCLLPARPIAHQYLAFHLCWPSAFEKWESDGFRAENQAVLRQFVDHAKEKGWVDTEFQVYYNEKPKFGYFPFEMDEPRRPEDLAALTRVSEIVRPAMAEAAPARFVFRVDIYNYDYMAEVLGDKIDLFNVSAGIDLGGKDWETHWGRGSGNYDVESIRQRQAEGARGWFYGGAGRIDFTPLILRRLGWQAWAWGADGFCLWCVDMWSPDPYNEVLDGEPGSRGFDFIYYPGGPVGSPTPIPSIRLKALRRGLQDYEYLWLIRERRGPVVADSLLCDEQAANPMVWDSALARLADHLIES